MKKRRRWKRPKRHGISIRLSAMTALGTAGVLLASAHLGGEDMARTAVSQLAQNDNFIARMVSLELGLSPSVDAVFAPRAAAAARSENVEDPDDDSVTIPESPGVQQEENSAPILSAADKAATVSVNNETSYDVDIAACLSASTTVHTENDGPKVLIFHTHGSESYTPDTAFPYQPTENERTTDMRYNVVRVGDELQNVLEEHGITSVHIREIYDTPTYSGSYDRSLAAINEALEEYPDIQVVIDVHRDSILTDDGRAYKTSCTIGEEEMAQLMFVVGTDDGGLEHPNWQENLNYVTQLQYQLNHKFPGLMRPVNLRTQRFNQHVRPGSMLIEVGSSGNTMPEALAAIRLFGQTLAEDLSQPDIKYVNAEN